MSSHQNSYFVSSTSPEQRLFLRKRVTLPLPIELLPGKEVWLDDLGEGGLSVSGSSRLELGTNTFLAFEFPEAKSIIEAAGVVAWCDTSGRAGVRFTRIKPDSTAALKRWLKSDLVAAPAPTTEPTISSAEIVLPLSRHGAVVANLREEIAGLESTAALVLIAERTLHLTRATGAAIALRNEAEVVCRASAGNAPTVGVKLDVGASLTGECYLTGNIVTMANAEKDSRIDPELRRQLNFRSLLIVPVISAQKTVGIAEVLSPVPGNFDGGDVLLLAAIAEFIAELCQNLKLASIPKAMAEAQR